ncbi:MAG TPA: permease-like cell division protein FtsX [Xanthomonadaceae bacterium]|nr:permease-like cell division protein FtsX [Xanthomonadaceae bacterium]
MNRRVAERRPKTTRRARGGGLGARLSAWRDLHLYSLVSSLGRLAQRPLASALTIAVMAIALALPLGLLLALARVEGLLGGEMREAGAVAVFAEHALAAEAVDALAEQVRAREDVAAVQLERPEQALDQFRQMTQFAGALAVMDYNPLPAVLQVTPAPQVDGAALAQALRGLDGVSFVQHDALWRERLGDWLRFGRRLGLVVALMLGLGALLVVGNTVRLDIQGRADEIAIVRSLGATDGFVRRPFLYLGAWYGLCAGVLALAIVAVAQLALAGPFEAVLDSYGGEGGRGGRALPWLAGTVLVAVALGWLGAWLASSHQLRAARAREVA